MHAPGHFPQYPGRNRFSAAVLAFLLLPASNFAQPAYKQTILHTFTGGSDGGQPQGILVADGNGNLYGTTMTGGNTTAPQCAFAQVTGCGVVFELSPPAAGSTAWTEHVLYKFKGAADGMWPKAGLIFDSHGNLYGTASAGGIQQACQYPEEPLGCGVVFELSPPAAGSTAWTEYVIYTFTGQLHADGAGPSSTLTFNNGSLYGTTYTGGSPNSCSGAAIEGCGSIFKLTPPSSGTGPWAETILYSSGPGWLPAAGVVFDAAGNLYGTDSYGGNDGCVYSTYVFGCGIVFKLSPPATPTGKWTETVLHAFTDGADGATPLGALILDAKGNLYGTTKLGGGAYGGHGVVFRLNPPVAGATAWTETVLHTFATVSTADGGMPEAGFLMDAKGSLYGTTSIGGYHASGTQEDGVAFELSPPSTGTAGWVDNVLYTFCSAANCSDGGVPVAGLISDWMGNIYGTTQSGGNREVGILPSYGVVFRLTPTQRPAATSTGIKISPAAIPVGSTGPVNVTATVWDVAGPGTPNGSVTLFNGSAQFGTGTLIRGVANFAYNTSALALGTYSITARYTGNSLFAASASAVTKLTIIPPLAATPTFSPAPGKYTSAQHVILSDTTAGAVMYYTLNGTTPSPAAGTKYTGPITVSATETIKAMATAPNHSNSAVATGIYTILKLQTITWAAITGTHYAATTLSLKATASSGLAVAFASKTPTVCTVSNTTASLLVAGTCTIQASQGGNTVYASAPVVNQSFSVTAKR